MADQGYGGQYSNGALPADTGASAVQKKKKDRRPVAAGYDFGGNAALSSTQQPIGYDPAGEQQTQAPYEQYPPSGVPIFGGGGYNSTPAPAQPQQPAYDSSGYGQQQPAVGGYQAPAAGYPTAAQPDVGGLTQQMGGMGFGATPQPPPQQPGQPNRPHLNQLYPTDMINQPFQVSELDLAPPPIVLPPNVSEYRYERDYANRVRPQSRHHQMRIVHRNTYDQP